MKAELPHGVDENHVHVAAGFRSHHSTQCEILSCLCIRPLCRSCLTSPLYTVTVFMFKMLKILSRVTDTKYLWTVFQINACVSVPQFNQSNSLDNLLVRIIWRRHSQEFTEFSQLTVRRVVLIREIDPGRYVMWHQTNVTCPQCSNAVLLHFPEKQKSNAVSLSLASKAVSAVSLFQGWLFSF